MSSIQITGVLRDPLGNLATNVPVKVTTVVGFGDTLTSAVATYSTSASGSYDFNLVYGYHAIEVRFYDKFVELGRVTVNADSTGPLTISELLTLSVPVTSPIIEEMNRILAEARQAEAAAEAAAARAEAAASAVTWKQHCRTEADMNQMIEQNKTQFTASGFVHYGKHFMDGNITPVNEGVWTNPGWVNYFFTGREEGVTAFGSSETPFPMTSVAGFISKLVGINVSIGRVAIKLPEAPDGTVTYDSNSGAVVQHANTADAFTAETATNKVVTERVDMFGFEYFLQSVDTTNPFVFPKGCIQSKATTMNGITTTTSNRPSTYFSVYPGDTSSDGLGVNFFAVGTTDEQRQEMVSDESNNLFVMNNGDLVQFCVRQRTIAGRGNGDWSNTDCTSGSLQVISDANNYDVLPQGVYDTDNGFAENAGMYLTPVDSDLTVSGAELGVFTARNINYDGRNYGAAGVDGRCYFHVCGKVLRLNQGAYHPSFNSLGTSTLVDAATESKLNQFLWYQAGAYKPTSRSECFTKQSSNTGKIGTISGHPDGRFCDAVYASGQGGVIDDRLSTWGMSSSEEASKITTKCVNSLYRGEQKLVMTKVFDSAGSVPAGWSIVDQSDASNVIAKTLLNLSVEGDMLYRNILGSAVNIKTTFPDGWLGEWGGAITNGSNVRHNLTRQSLEGGTYQFTPDNGASWSNGVAGVGTGDGQIDLVTNTIGISLATTAVFLLNYTVKAHVTKRDNLQPVFNGANGLLEVLVTQSYLVENGALLAESVIDEIVKSNATGVVTESSDVLKYRISNEIKRIKTLTTDMVAPTNSSKAVKIAVYQVSIDRKLYLGFIANTMSHNGANWGELQEMDIPSGLTGTFIDSNGVTQTSSKSLLTKHYGYSVNHARASEQVKGVDL